MRRPQSVARRFGISAVTVRRLEAQLDGATSGEIAALRASNLNLSVHAVIARFVPADEREDVIRILSAHRTKSGELTSLFTALGWQRLVALGPAARRVVWRFCAGHAASCRRHHAGRGANGFGSWPSTCRSVLASMPRRRRHEVDRPTARAALREPGPRPQPGREAVRGAAAGVDRADRPRRAAEGGGRPATSAT